MAPIGNAVKVEFINKKSVEVALKARDKCKKKNVQIAGSISNSVINDVLRRPDDEFKYKKRHYVFDLDEWREPSRLIETYEEQISILKQEGVDLILLEMMESPEFAMPAIKTAVD